LSDEIPEEKILNSEEIYDGKIVHLFVQTVDVGNGRIHERELVKHNGAVAMVPLDTDGNVVLVKQYRSGAEQVLLELPAGTLEPDEDRLAAARRELQEEIGYFPEKLTYMGEFYVAASYTTEKISIYLAEELRESKLVEDEDEIIVIQKLPFDDALSMAMENKIIDSKSIIGLTWAAIELGKIKTNS